MIPNNGYSKTQRLTVLFFTWAVFGFFACLTYSAIKIPLSSGEPVGFKIIF